MPRSDMPSHPKGLPTRTINDGKVYNKNVKDRVTAPLLGENQGDSGKSPSTTHSKNLPMTDNKRAPFKSRCIFDY